MMRFRGNFSSSFVPFELYNTEKHVVRALERPKKRFSVSREIQKCWTAWKKMCSGPRKTSRLRCMPVNSAQKVYD